MKYGSLVVVSKQINLSTPNCCFLTTSTIQFPRAIKNTYCMYTTAFIAKLEIFRINFFRVVPAECLSSIQTKCSSATQTCRTSSLTKTRQMRGKSRRPVGQTVKREEKSSFTCVKESNKTGSQWLNIPWKLGHCQLKTWNLRSECKANTVEQHVSRPQTKTGDEPQCNHDKALLLKISQI